MSISGKVSKILNKRSSQHQYAESAFLNWMSKG